MKQYNLAPITCQNCMYCKYESIGNAICSKKKFPVPEEKLKVTHIKKCEDYKFWLERKK